MLKHIQERLSPTYHLSPTCKRKSLPFFQFYFSNWLLPTHMQRRNRIIIKISADTVASPYFLINLPFHHSLHKIMVADRDIAQRSSGIVENKKMSMVVCIKGTLTQIWKSPYMLVFIQKQYSENFAFLTPRILELFFCKVCKFLKK